jgi:ribonuclease VapC
LNHYVLDSYAVLTLLGNEPGASRVEKLMLQAQSGKIKLWMSLINLGEVAYIIEQRWGVEKLRAMLAYLEATALLLAEVNKDQVLAAAHFKATYTVAYADAFAIALAKQHTAVLVTGDPEYRQLEHQIDIEWLAE